MKKVFLFIAIALSAVACCTPCNKSYPKVSKFESDVWRLVEFRYSKVTDSPITLTFNAEEKMVYGTAACNNFFGGYVLSGSKDSNIKFQNMGSTKMYCPDSELEEAFVASLQGVVKLKMDGDNLMLLDSDGEMTALMEKVAQ